jgi:hypothetical protein
MAAFAVIIVSPLCYLSSQPLPVYNYPRHRQPSMPPATIFAI